MNINKLLKAFTLSVIFLSLLSCGFNLRGYSSTAFPEWLKQIQINVPNGEVVFFTKLKTNFNNNGIKVVNSAKTKLNIKSVKFNESNNIGDKNINSVLSLTVVYSLIKENTLINQATISKQTMFEYSKSNLLVAENLKQTTKEYLLQEVSQGILNQISKKNAGPS